MGQGLSIDRREVRAAGLCAAIVGLYTIAVLATGRVNLFDFGLLFSRYLSGSLSLMIFILVAAFGWFALTRRPASPARAIAGWLRDRWRRDRLASFFLPPLLFALLMAAFNSFKQMVLPAAGFSFDPMFAEMDRALGLGHDPWRITHALFGSPEATWWLDRAYHGWFLPMSLGLMVCALLPASTWRLRTRYMLSYAMIWIGIGSFLAFLLPSAGPCFYSQFVGPAPEFQVLMDRLASQQAALGSPVSALIFQEVLLSLHGSNELAVGAGISAMPSVHNGLAILFAIAAFKIDRRFGWVMSGYAAIIWIGSIHLGWHYAIDGLVALPLVLGIWRMTGWVADWLERPSPQQAPVAAAA